MKLASVNAGLIAAALGLLTSIPLVIVGSLVFAQKTPNTPAVSNDHTFVSGSIDYGSRS